MEVSSLEIEIREPSDFEECEDYENFIDDLIGDSEICVFVQEDKTVILEP